MLGFCMIGREGNESFFQPIIDPLCKLRTEFCPPFDFGPCVKHGDQNRRELNEDPQLTGRVEETRRKFIREFKHDVYGSRTANGKECL